MGAILQAQNALPNGVWIRKSPSAKDDVDNVGAGRAAKGENLVFCAYQLSSSNNKTPFVGVFLFLLTSAN